MAGSSKKGNNQELLSPEKYVRTKCRLLPLGKSFINQEWEDSGMCTIVVSRNHSNGNITCGIFLVDNLCLGLKDSIFKFNISELEFEELLDALGQKEDIVEIEYPLAHNLIYGAIEFAKEYDFKPHKSFQLTQYILSEDDDQTELIDVNFGIEEKPAIVVSEEDPQKSIIAHLEKNPGPGNYIIINADEEYEEDDDEEIDDALLGNYSDYSDDELMDQIKDADQEDPAEILDQVFELYVRLHGIDKFDALKDKYAPAFEKLEIVNDYRHSALDFLPEDQMYRFYEIQELLKEAPKKAIKELEKTLVSDPHPVYYNLLYSAYDLLEESEKAQEILEMAIKIYSNDLMTRINYAYFLLEQEQFNTIKLFMSGFDIHKLLPQRNVYHINEITEFLNLACQYFAHTNQLLVAAVFQEILDSYKGIPPMIFDHKLQTFEWICELQLHEINKELVKVRKSQ